MIYLLTIAVILGVWVEPYSPKLYKEASLVTTEASTPLVEVTPTPSSSDVVVAIAKEFEPEGKTVVKKMIDIAFCESGWRWDAKNTNTNGTQDHGSLQINDVHTKRYGTGFKNDLTENVKVAHKIFKASGVNPWVCAGKLSYK